MANKVGKGFLVYLGIFLLIILGIFVVLGAILIIFPSASIFGLSYYSYGKMEMIKEVGNVPINYETLKEINFKTNKASVIIKHSDTTDPILKLDKRAYGFTVDSETKEFKTTYLYENDVLSVEITEPSGFLEFSNNTKYILELPVKKNLSDTTVNVTTKSGSISIGGAYEDALKDYPLAIKSLDLKTTSGDITISYHSSGDFDFVNMVSDSGGLYLNRNVKTHSSILLKSNSGKIKTAEITSSNINIETYKSIIEMGNLNANVSFKGKLGNVYIGNISGSFEANENVENSNFTLGEVSGQVLIPSAETTNVKILKSLDTVKIVCTGGSLEIGEAVGALDLDLGSASANITVSKDNNKNKIIKNTSGTITMVYDDVLASTKIISTKGHITFRFYNNAVFNLKTHGKDGNVTYNWLENIFVPAENEYNIGSNMPVNDVEITSSGKISVNLMEGK